MNTASKPLLRIVFDGPPAPQSGRFVECENENRASVKAGEWTQEGAMWVLTVTSLPTVPLPPPFVPVRKVFTMTEAQKDRLLDACRPVPYMMIGSLAPTSPQENANRAWNALGRELGFDGATVEPIPGVSDVRVFTALTTQEARVTPCDGGAS